MLGLVAAILFAFQTPFTSAAPSFRLTVPAGFTQLPEGRAQQGVIECWGTEPADSQLPVVLCVQRLGGVLPREAVSAAEVPAGTEVLTFKWKTFDIHGFRQQVTRDGEQLFSLIAQVPLRDEAIQVVSSGPLANEADGRAAVNAVLASLEGESNWLTGEERAERLGKSVGAWVGIGLAAFVVWRWRKKKEAEKKPPAKRPGPSTSARPRPRTP